MAKYRIVCKGKNFFDLIHPNGYWIGHGMGGFPSAAAAMDWFVEWELPRIKR